MVKFLGSVAQSEVPVRNTGKGPRPELVPIIEAIVANVPVNDRCKKSGKEVNIQFVKVQVEDKKESERIREALRGQLKSQGYNVQMATDARMVSVSTRDERTGKKTGEKKQVLRMYVYAAAFSKDVGEPETPEESTNGTSEEKPKRDRKAERERRAAKQPAPASA